MLEGGTTPRRDLYLDHPGWPPVHHRAHRIPDIGPGGIASERCWRYAFLHHAGWGGAVMAGPGKTETAAAASRSHGSLRASHADREQVIGTLKAAFVQATLAKDEFDLR